MDRSSPAGASAAGFGVAFVLTGVALLLQELGVLTLTWSLVLPLIVMAAGLVVLVSGLLGAHRSRTR